MCRKSCVPGTEHLLTLDKYIYARLNEKMSHPGSRDKRSISAKDDEEELLDTGIEMANDSEIQADHNLEESQNLLRKSHIVKRKSCIHNTCRICMGIMATAVFTFMLIQLWANYGDDIKKRVFSPQVAGAGSYTFEGAVGDTFGMNFHKYENKTLHLNITKPEQDLVSLDFKFPRNRIYEWDEDCLKIEMDDSNSVNVLVWSI